MALKNCKECGNQVSRSAKSCPQCGARQGMSFIKKLGIGFLILVIIGVMNSKNKTNRNYSSSSSSTENQPAPQTENPFTVTAEILHTDYKANEIAADKKYKGKLLAVTGKVGDIKKGVIGGLYVTLKSENNFSITSVQCFFDKEHEEKLARINQGQTITITGRCEGLLGNILIKNCQL